MKSSKILDLLLFTTLIYVSKSAVVRPADFCGSDKDCNSANFCNFKLNKCVHFPMSRVNTVEVVGLFFIQFLLILTNSVGLQGGAIILPVLVFFLEFNVKEAIPLIKAMSFFGAVIYTVFQRKLKHPNRDAPAVNYPVVLMATPVLLLGTLTGLNVSMAIPSWMILLISIGFLLYFIYKTVNKGVESFQNEQREKVEQRRIIEEKEIIEFIKSIEQIENKTTKCSEESPNENSRGNHGFFENLDESDHNEDNDHLLEISGRNLNKEEIHEIEQRMAQSFPWRILTVITALVLVFLFLLFLKGSKTLPSFAGIRSCSLGYWYVYLGFAAVCICSVGLIGWYLTSQHTRKCAIGFQFVQHDLHWSWKLVVILSVYSFVLGLIGPIGVGSSSLTIPLLLDMGLSREQGSATSTFINIIAGLGIGAEFISNGLLSFEWTLVLSAVCVVSVIVAVLFMQKIIKHLGNAYIWVVLLGVVLLAGNGLLIYSTVLDINKIKEKGLNIWTFASAC